MITKIISGGQTGVDIAALRYAKQAGIETGGWMTRGCRTADGPKPEYLELYNMKESKSPYYSDRTNENVRDSDGTLIIVYDKNSPGTKCTIKAANQWNKPWFLIDCNLKSDTSIEVVVDWIKENNIHILNVAGNRLTDKNPKIEHDARYYLARIIWKLMEIHNV